MPTIRITVSGGMVQSVECDDPRAVRVILVDSDCDDPNDDDARELDGKIIKCCDYPVDLLDLADGVTPEDLPKPDDDAAETEAEFSTSDGLVIRYV